MGDAAGPRRALGAHSDCAGAAGRGRKRARKAKKASREKASKTRERASAVKVETPAKKRTILVNAIDPEETRVAVIEDGAIVDLHMTAK